MRDIVQKEDGDNLSADNFNTMKNEIQTAVSSAGLTLDIEAGPDSRLNMLAEAFSIYSKVGQTYIDSGTANAYILNGVGNFRRPKEYYPGYLASFKATNANTGASTVNINSLGVKNIVDHAGNSLSSGDIISGQYYLLIYDQGLDHFELTPNFIFASLQEVLNRNDLNRVISPSIANQARFAFIPPGIIRRTEISLVDFLFCEGQEVSRNTYSDLFAVIGTTFGSGDGSNTFNLPNIEEYNQSTVSAPNQSWGPLSVNTNNGDIWIVDFSSNRLYKNAGGNTEFILDALSPTDEYTDVTVNNSTNVVYSSEQSGFIRSRNPSSGVWSTHLSTSRFIRGISANSINNDLWFCEAFFVSGTGNIWKQTGATGSATQASGAPTGVNWQIIIVNPNNGDVFAAPRSGQIYRSAGGGSTWTAMNPSTLWRGIAINLNTNDVLAAGSAGIYINRGGVENSFTLMNLPGNRIYDGLYIYPDTKRIIGADSNIIHSYELNQYAIKI